jgi:hypothetical protein
VAGKPLAIRLVIERAPFTADYFWQERGMKRVFLSRSTDSSVDKPIAPRDAVHLSVLEPEQRWEAVYPLEPGPAEGTSAGVVYVRQPFVQGARYHFGIQYELRFEKGRLAPSSDLWMGALFRGRAKRIAPEEWFSHEPIPVLPEKQPENLHLLGVTTDEFVPKDDAR